MPSEKPYYSSSPENPDHDIELCSSRSATQTSNPAVTRTAKFADLTNDVGSLTIGGQDVSEQGINLVEIIIRWGRIIFRIRIDFGSKRRGSDARALSQEMDADETLSCDFKDTNTTYRRRSSDFFKAGRVFAVPWSNETNPPNAYDVPGVSGVTQAQERLFIVVKEGDRSCLALPMSVYREQEARQPGDASYIFVYSSKQPPKVTSNAQRMSQIFVRAVLDDRAEKFDPHTRVDMSKTSKITFGVPVRNVGTIHSDSWTTLVYSLQSVRSRRYVSQSMVIEGRLLTIGLGSTGTTGAPAAYNQSNRPTSSDYAQVSASSSRPVAISSTDTQRNTAGRVDSVQSSPTSSRSGDTYLQQLAARGYTTERAIEIYAPHLISGGWTREQAIPYIQAQMRQVTERSSPSNTRNQDSYGDSDDDSSEENE